MTPLPSDLEAIFFDLDGTLIDTDDHAAEQLAAWLRPLVGRRADRLGRRLTMWAETPINNTLTLLDQMGLDAPLMKVAERLRGPRPPSPYRLVPGVEPMIAALQGRYRLGLVTTRNRRQIDAFLAQFPPIAAAIEVTCGAQDTRRLKPHPSPVRLAAERLGVPVARCLMVGDTTVDVTAARRAGAWSAAVLCGFGTREELEQAGAHIILESTADLARFLGAAG
ncbi:MAG: HAD family hydrolase [Anaerolineae bacterium]